MNFKKTTALFLAAAMTATALTACGGSDTNGGSADNGSAGGTITVDFWTAPQQVQYNFWETKAKAFNETKTEVNGQVVEVKVQQMPESPSSEPQAQRRLFLKILTEVLRQHWRLLMLFMTYLQKNGLMMLWMQDRWAIQWQTGQLTENSMYFRFM